MKFRAKKSIEDVLLKKQLINEEQANQIKLEIASSGFSAENVILGMFILGK
jgi:hypothetical protein